MHFILLENLTTPHLGPIEWRPRMFKSYLEDELEITTILPQTNTGIVEINPTLSIYPARIVEPEIHNPKINQYAGPTWSVVNGEAIGQYISIDKDINTVLQELKGAVASKRWEEEIKGIPMTIQALPVVIDTSREGRRMFLDALNVLPDNSTVGWKFNDTFINITKLDLQSIVNAISAHVQACFSWEQQKISELDAASLVSLNALDSVQLVYP